MTSQTINAACSNVIFSRLNRLSHSSTRAILASYTVSMRARYRACSGLTPKYGSSLHYATPSGFSTHLKLINTSGREIPGRGTNGFDIAFCFAFTVHFSFIFIAGSCFCFVFVYMCFIIIVKKKIAPERVSSMACVR